MNSTHNPQSPLPFGMSHVTRPDFIRAGQFLYSQYPGIRKMQISRWDAYGKPGVFIRLTSSGPVRRRVSAKGYSLAKSNRTRTSPVGSAIRNATRWYPEHLHSQATKAGGRQSSGFAIDRYFSFDFLCLKDVKSPQKQHRLKDVQMLVFGENQAENIPFLSSVLNSVQSSELEQNWLISSKHAFFSPASPTFWKIKVQNSWT